MTALTVTLIAIGAVCAIAIAWLAYEIVTAPVINDDTPSRLDRWDQPGNTTKETS